MTVRSLQIARVLLSTQYATMLEYRAEIALWALSGVLPLIMLAVWQGSDGAAAAGLSSTKLAHYFVAAFLVRQFSVVWMIHVFEEDTLQGKLSPQLLQPLQPLWRYFCRPCCRTSDSAAIRGVDDGGLSTVTTQLDVVAQCP